MPVLGVGVEIPRQVPLELFRVVAVVVQVELDLADAVAVTVSVWAPASMLTAASKSQV